jgi:molybdopterin-guanine dinucleotide biosynthesis protein A
MRVSTPALPQVRRLLDAGRRALHDLVAALHAVEVPLAAGDAAALANVNTPQDAAILAAAEQPD